MLEAARRLQRVVPTVVVHDHRAFRVTRYSDAVPRSGRRGKRQNEWQSIGLLGTREHSARRIAMDISEWLQQFLETKTTFDSTRGCVSAVVRVTFRDGWTVIAREIHAGPGDGYITISPYPDDPKRDMIPGRDKGSLPATPTMIICPFHTVERIELLAKSPGSSEVGFVQWKK